MTITSKEIKTEIHVEISREEFCDNYQAMFQDILVDRYINEKIEAQANQYSTLTDNEKNKWAQESFESHFGLVHTAVIEYIARSNEMYVDNYGYHNRSLDCICATFYMRGAHL